MFGLLVLLTFSGASACSYVEIPVPDSTSPNGTKYVIGRTNELGHIFNAEKYRVKVHPRSGSNHGYVALEGSIPNPEDAWIVFDGMNEAGLTLGAQTLRESEYEAVGPLGDDILWSSLVQRLLECCKDVDEALDFLKTHRVVGPSHSATGFHWAVADANGRSVVIEYLKGERVVWENTPRVMTNDPPMDFHWRNLNLYVNLNPRDPYQNEFMSVDTIVGTAPRTIGHGSNLLGLPGDGSPPSRYIQLFYLRGYAIHAKPPKSTRDATVITMGLLNKVFIPYGVFGMPHRVEGLIESTEYTPVGIIKVPFEKRLLFRGYQNQQWRQVDLSQLDFSKDVDIEWPVEDGTLGIKDVTSSKSPADSFAV